MPSIFSFPFSIALFLIIFNLILSCAAPVMAADDSRSLSLEDSPALENGNLLESLPSPASASMFLRLPTLDSVHASAILASETALLTSAPAPDTFYTMDDCLRTALERNRLIRMTTEKVAAAQERKRQVGLTQRPSASLVTQEQKLKTATSPTTRDRQDTHRLTITESAQIFGRNRAQRRVAEANIRAMDAERLRIIQDVTFLVKKTFYDVLLTQDLMRVAADSLEQLKAHRDHTEHLVSAGSAPRFDLLRAEVQLASARPALIRAIRARMTTMADMMHLLGLDPLSNAALDGTFPESVPNLPASEADALAVALRDRPDLAAARASEEIARQQVSVAKQALQPSLQMTGNLERTRGIRSPADQYQDQWNVTMGLNFPVFDSGLSRSQTREAESGFRQASLNTDQTLSALKVEIRKAFSAIQEASEVLRSQERNVEQAMEALSIAQTAYETGAKTALDVLDAQLALTQTRNLKFQALRDRAVAIAQMEKALGQISTVVLDAEEIPLPASGPATQAVTASTPALLGQP